MSAETLTEDQTQIPINGSSWDYGLGYSAFNLTSSGSIYVLAQTNYVGASSVYVQIEPGTNGSSIKRSNSSAGGSVSITQGMGTYNNSNLYHNYSTHRIYKNGVLAGTGNTSIHW
ncbi:hypothetical protein ACFSW4_05965 [Piscibacillus salipiscarius]|uniref:Uncharacterized protein n=1 Tax=Piscibacillus salipiscarius TaxID=299480 RepID=A0ABW5Q9I0_9BACI|nr:hypothetical protein [Piscibacillus salipiscarius]